MKLSIVFTASLLAGLAVMTTVHGHGRLVKPAGRGTLWRFPEFDKYDPIPDYDDNQCFCGGFYVQYSLNNGKCGICGDAWHDPQPRDHEGGGIYGKGIITGQYKAGQVIDVSVQLTAAHLGYFEFRLCPHNDSQTPVTQECLDQYLLPIADGTGRTRFPIPTFEARFYNYSVQLPEDVTCKQCVLQWHYNTGNSHGYCEDGSFELGCGDQETFRGCADIRIS